MKKHTWILLSCLAFINMGIIAPSNADAQNNSPYLRDVYKVLQVRKLIDERYGVLASVAKIANKNDTDKVLILSDTAKMIISDIVSAYFNDTSSVRASNTTKPANGRNQPGTPGGLEQPGRNGPSASDLWEDFERMPNSGTQLNADERTEVEHELTAILLVSDETVVRSGGLRHFPDFPKTFPHIQRFIDLLQAKSLVSRPVEPQSSSLLGGGFAFNEAAIIQGITDWAIRTAKRELLEAVLERYYDSLSNNIISSTLLTHTLNTFKQFKDDHSLNLAKYGSLWKASFQQDLREVPVHLQDEAFVTTVVDQLAPGWAIAPEIVPLISGGSSLVYGIYQKKHPVEIITELSTTYLTEATSITQDEPVFKRSVLLAHVLTEAIGEFDQDQYKIMSLRDLRNLTAWQWSTFLGLIYGRNREELTLSFGSDPVDILTELRAGPQAKWYNLLVGTITSWNSIRELLYKHNAANEETEDKQLTSEQVSKVMQVSGQLLTQVLPYLKAKTMISARIDSVLTHWDEISHDIAQIGEGVSTREYGMVLDGTVKLLAYGNVVFARHVNRAPAATRAIHYLTKYGSFMANVLMAQSSDAVEQAIDELVPHDQYRLKNSSALGLSLSVYPGAFAGWETIHTFKTQGAAVLPGTEKSRKGSLSFYLPVGIDLSTGFGNSSLILFLQALDLGAVLNYRLTAGDSTEQANPNISFKQLLSPGINLMYQVNNTPIVVGAGINYTPSLRKIQLEGSGRDVNAFRAGFFVAVDVTAFHISLSKKKINTK